MNMMRKPTVWAFVITFGLSVIILVLYLWYRQWSPAAQHPPGGSDKCGFWLDNPMNDFCYLLDRETSKIWEEAQDHCVLLGGNLLSINDSYEQTFVLGLTAVEPIVATSLWLGANTPISKDGAEWCDGSPITYVHLEAGNPDDDNPGRCLAFITSSGYWRADACNNKRGFICKKRGNMPSPVLDPEHLPIPSAPKQESPQLDLLFGEANLEWKQWDGSLPDNAVSIDNSYASRVEYICKVDCHAGVYIPKAGEQVCAYTSHGAAYTERKFELLVNMYNFEVLEWVNDKDGSVPRYSIQTCINTDNYYIGKNRYGLGEVDVSQKVFNLPWKGSVWTYPEYEILVMNKDVKEEHLMDIKYETDGVTPLKYIPQEVKQHSIPNWSCHLFKDKVTFYESLTVTQKWEINFRVLVEVGITITAGIPFLNKDKIDFKPVSTFKLSQRTSTYTTNQPVTVLVTVPPHQSCDIKLLGSPTIWKIPFTARFKRTYGNGKTKSVRVTGTFHYENFDEFTAEIQSCGPLPGANPC
ncbi:natterin-3-like isoform X2 [Festucalex cinctus]